MVEGRREDGVGWDGMEWDGVGVVKRETIQWK